MVSKGQGEVDKNKTVNIKYKPRVPYPNATRKDHSDEKFGELTLLVEDKALTLQARNSDNTSEIEGDRLNHSIKTDHMIQPTLQEISLKEVHEPLSNNSREELDEWRTHKPRTHDKQKLRQNEPDTSPNQLKVGDKVLLVAADPHIVTTTPNEEIPLTVLSIFTFSMVEVSHPKFGTFKVHNVVFKRKENRRTCFKEEEGSVLFHGSNHENSSPSPIVSPRAPRRTVPNTSGRTFNCGKLYRLGCCRTRRRESTSVINTHDAYFLWCMLLGHVIDLAYFIALVIQHQTERHRKGVISIDPYVTQLARHFGLLNTATQESSITLIYQMSPQGISSMLSMRMIERHRGAYPPQYRLAQSTDEEAYEDIPDDVP
ncbi:hypothetical protein GOBAR_AA38950 [Gossypium barbadense]|uniref:Uncharacterized protein n=1 Tax=Gossypium barbadense TaxID=3634 RepID=A0A2P5VSD9_GOSBA|nr:hypothetical protein GOBAR_AA38950 [Gossypium barbadense]